MLSVLGVFASIRHLFDRSMWGVALFHKLFTTNIIDLNGTWGRHTLSSYNGHSTKDDATLKITQTWANICDIYPLLPQVYFAL